MTNNTKAQPADEAKVTFTKMVNQTTAPHQERIAKQAAEGIINPMELAVVAGVRPQMIYNYIRAGKIKSVKDNNTQKLTIELGEAYRFVHQYVTGKEQREAAKAELRAKEAEAEVTEAE